MYIFIVILFTLTGMHFGSTYVVFKMEVKWLDIKMLEVIFFARQNHSESPALSMCSEL